MRSMRYFICNEVFDKEVFSFANCGLKQHEIESEFREKNTKVNFENFRETQINFLKMKIREPLEPLEMIKSMKKNKEKTPLYKKL